MAIIVLIQKDLRLHDHPALYYGAQESKPIIPIYVQPREIGSASLWWQYHSIQALNKSFASHGIRLLFCGDNLEKFLDQIRENTPVDAIYGSINSNELSPKYQSLYRVFDSNLLSQPQNLGRPFKIYSPFWRHLQANVPIPLPLGIPDFKDCHPHQLPRHIGAIPLDLPFKGPVWWKDMEDFWSIGEAAALKKWKSFCEDAIRDYGTNKEIPGVDGTSRLSPHLHFGEISVRQMWRDLHDIEDSEGKTKFMAQLGWREFSHNLLHHHPDLRRKPLQEKFEHYPWVYDQNLFNKWTRGKTGIPLVDAGMRQLWQTGWMHNRVRMITASFLSKNLRLPWQWGEQWFFDTLVDGDAALNATNWQWVAGCGTDHAPYFRIFNPVLQAEKFDPKGSYIRKFVPELSHEKNFQGSFDAVGEGLFSSAYGEPIVDLGASRAAALEAFSSISKKV